MCSKDLVGAIAGAHRGTAANQNDRGECKLSCVRSQLRSILTGASAAAIGISLTMAAMAQESPRLRTPRRLVPDPIGLRSTVDGFNLFGNDPNHMQGPGPGPIGPGPGCNLLPAPASVGTK